MYLPDKFTRHTEKLMAFINGFVDVMKLSADYDERSSITSTSDLFNDYLRHYLKATIYITFLLIYSIYNNE